MAAARHILMICGSTEIDGYAFCLGVNSLNIDDPDLRSLVRSVTYLIKGAIFRPSYANSGSGRSSLDICPLSELMDMYRCHKATVLHDKVYALLGMSSDDLSKAGLLPNYRVPWEELFRNLVRYLFHDKISVETLRKQTILIKSKGYILGEVFLQKSTVTQGVNVFFNNTPMQREYEASPKVKWSLHASAKPIQNGDLVCLLQGNIKPTIIRLHDHHFDIIMIAATLPEETLGVSQSTKTFSRDFLLIWDWEEFPGESQDPRRHETLLQSNDWVSEHSEIEIEDQLEKATTMWNLGMIFRDSKNYGTAEEYLQKALIGCEIAAQGGHEALVKKLLKTSEVEADDKHIEVNIALWLAAKGGHDTMVKLLLGTGGVELNSRNEDGRTALHEAVAGGHLAVVERLLEAKADVNIKAIDLDGQTALQIAAVRGNLAVVERLLEAKADANTIGMNGRTALQAAALEGRLAVVERLLEAKAEVNITPVGWDQRTALESAARGGYLAIVERLLEAQADVNHFSGGWDGRTALEAAAAGGHVAVVERLLEVKAEVNNVRKGDRTALQAAAAGGHVGVVERLLEAKADVNRDAAAWDRRTALEAVAAGGHQAVIECLQNYKRPTSVQRTESKGLSKEPRGYHKAAVVK